MNRVREAVSKEKKRLRLSQEGFNLDLSYITDNIVAMGFPSEGIEGAFRNQMSEIIRFLEKYHRDKYMVYNLCAERVYLPLKFNNQMRSFPFFDHNPPAMSLLREFCVSLEYWLALDSENIAVIHCKAGKGRTGVVICCYLMHCGQCKTTDEAMQFYAAARTNDGKGVTIASQQRYVRYYEKLLTIMNGMEPGRVFAAPQLYIKRLRLANLSTSVKTAFIRIVCRSRKYKSFIQKVKKESRSIAFNFKEPAPVREDVKVTVYEKEKVELFTFWFNTGFIEEDLILVLKKNELDKPKSGKDKTKSFPEDFSIYVTFLDDAQLRMYTESKNGLHTSSKGDVLRAEGSGIDSESMGSTRGSKRERSENWEGSSSSVDSEEEEQAAPHQNGKEKKDKGKARVSISNGASSPKGPSTPRGEKEDGTPRKAGPDFRKKAKVSAGTVVLAKEKLITIEEEDGMLSPTLSPSGRRPSAAMLDFSNGDNHQSPDRKPKSPKPKATSEQVVSLSRDKTNKKKDRRLSQEVKTVSGQNKVSDSDRKKKKKEDKERDKKEKAAAAATSPRERKKDLKNNSSKNVRSQTSEKKDKEKRKKEESKELSAKEKKKRMRTTSFNGSTRNTDNDKVPTTPKASRRDMKRGQSSAGL